MIQFYLVGAILSFFIELVLIFSAAFLKIMGVPNICEKWSLTYLSLKCIFASFLWPIFIIPNAIMAFYGRDFFAELIKYDHSW